jgi:hypothetical protein
VADVRRGVLRNKHADNLCIALDARVPCTQPRMRRGAVVAPVYVNLTRSKTVDVPELLSCDVQEALQVIDRSPDVIRFVRRGLLEVM